jgi:hypothetical protein
MSDSPAGWNASQTPGMRTVAGGISLFVPNSVLNGKDFYISHNKRDTAYGCETTALVMQDDMTRFYLNSRAVPPLSRQPQVRPPPLGGAARPQWRGEARRHSERADRPAGYSGAACPSM